MGSIAERGRRAHGLARELSVYSVSFLTSNALRICSSSQAGGERRVACHAAKGIEAAAHELRLPSGSTEQGEGFGCVISNLRG